MKTSGVSVVTCSQCGRAAADPDELQRWRPSGLATAGELDELTAARVLCPECAAHDLLDEDELGEAD